MVASTLPYDHPTRLQLRALAGGDVEAALASAQLYLEEHRQRALPAPALAGVLAGLRRKVRAILVEARLLVALEGGAAFEVRPLEQADPSALAALVAGKRAAAPGDREREAAKLRKRKQRELEKQRGEASPPSAPSPGPVTSGVTPPVTAPVTPRDMADVTPVTAPVTAPVTSPATDPEPGPATEVSPEKPADSTATATADVTPPSHACASEENSPSPLPPSQNFKNQEGEEREEKSGERDAGHAGVVAQVVAAWSAVTGRPEGEALEADRAAVRRRLDGGATWEQFRAALAHLTFEFAAGGWFAAGDRSRLATLCGKPWEEAVRKGTLRLRPPAPVASPPPPSTPTLSFAAFLGPAPQGLARTAPPAPAPVSPSPPPELIPFSAYPTHGRQRVFFAHDLRYPPCPERGGWLRPDLVAAQQGAA